MGGIMVSPNPKRTKVQININGDEVKPFTKEVIQKNIEVPYQPTRDEVATLAAKPPQEPATRSRIEQIIESKIEAMIEKKITDILEKLLK